MYKYMYVYIWSNDSRREWPLPQVIIFRVGSWVVLFHFSQFLANS